MNEELEERRTRQGVSSKSPLGQNLDQIQHPRSLLGPLAHLRRLCV